MGSAGPGGGTAERSPADSAGGLTGSVAGASPGSGPAAAPPASSASDHRPAQRGHRGLHPGPNGRGGGGGLRERSRGRGLGRRSRGGYKAGAAGAGILATAGEAALGAAQLARRQGASRWRGRPRRWWALPGLWRGASTQRATSWASRAGRAEARTASGAVDIQTLNGMQESGVQQHFAMRQSQRQRPEVPETAIPRPASAAGPRQASEAAALALRPEPHPPAAATGPIQRQRGASFDQLRSDLELA